MASLESKSNASVGEVVVLAIGVCMVVVIAVTIVIYLTCFKNGPRFGLAGPGAVGPRGANASTGKDHKRKQKLKFGDDFKKRGTMTIGIYTHYESSMLLVGSL